MENEGRQKSKAIIFDPGEVHGLLEILEKPLRIQIYR